MNVKSVVKVMNFHSLLRVDNARKKADKYLLLEKEIFQMIDMIINNENLIRDKKMLTLDENQPELIIYFGSDYGFCGNINSNINRVINAENTADKIIVGKKLHSKEDILVKIKREDFTQDYGKINSLINQAVTKRKYSKIILSYNHYHNMSTIEQVEKCIYPMELSDKKRTKHTEDFAIEGNVTTLLENLIIEYLNYEIKIAEVNSFASENIIRQNATSDSLKKIDEIEEEKIKNERKTRNQKAFQKAIDSYFKKDIGSNE